MSADIDNLSEAEEEHQKTHNSHTHVSHTSANMTYSNTQYFKSLRFYLTRDALPSENHYRNLLSIGDNSEMRKFSRPTLDELHNKEEEGKLLEDSKIPEIVGKGVGQKEPLVRCSYEPRVFHKIGNYRTNIR